MASVTGSQLAFFGPSGVSANTNIVLTSTGTNLPTPAVGKFNVEVFTATPASGFTLAAGYDASAFIAGAVAVS